MVKAVATGYRVGAKHCDSNVLVKLLCRAVEYEGVVYTGETYEELMKKVNLVNEDFDLLEDVYNDEHLLKYTFYDDVFFDPEDKNFKYFLDSNIRIGTPHCCCSMIYLTCIYEGTGGNREEQGSTDDTMYTLIAWKNLLVKMGRMENTLFESIGSCCT